MNSSSQVTIRLESGSLWKMAKYERVVTFIGAGGKTTCLQTITQEINSAGQRVIATTTTKVFPEQHIMAWKNTCPPPNTIENACFWYTQVEDESGKWLGPSLKTVDAALADDLQIYRFWVIEGDGARGHKLKCWASHEPQIPEYTECAVLVLDQGLWGKVLRADQVHRGELCRNLIGHIWNADQAWNYFLASPVFAPQYGHMDWVILLNGPGKIEEDESCKEIKDSSSSTDPLQNLYCRWVEIRQNIMDLKFKPGHLRLAAGDAKEGDLRWFDLW
jgi:probable selenium-dependent hydroxylase accessory protein YqeC